MAISSIKPSPFTKQPRLKTDTKEKNSFGNNLNQKILAYGNKIPSTIEKIYMHALLHCSGEYKLYKGSGIS